MLGKYGPGVLSYSDSEAGERRRVKNDVNEGIGEWGERGKLWAAIS